MYKMESEAADMRVQIASAHEIETKYTEAVIQLAELRAQYKQTTDNFEKEKLLFKVVLFSNIFYFYLLLGSLLLNRWPD